MGTQNWVDPLVIAALTSATVLKFPRIHAPKSLTARILESSLPTGGDVELFNQFIEKLRPCSFIPSAKDTCFAVGTMGAVMPKIAYFVLKVMPCLPEGVVDAILVPAGK